MKNNFFQGISWKLANLFIFSLITVINKIIITESNLNIIQIFSMEMLFGFAFLMSLGFGFKMERNNKTKIIYVRVILEIASMLLWFFCLKMVPATLGMSIRNITPILTSLLAVLILKEKSSRGLFISILFAFIGGMIIGGFNFSAIQIDIVDSFFTIILVVSAIFNSMSEIINKKLCNDGFSLKNNALISFGLSGFLTLPFAAFYWKELSIKYLLYIIMVSMLFVANYLCHLKAIKSTYISLLVPFSFSKLLFTSVIAYFMIGEVVSWNVINGSIFILIGLSVIGFEQWKKKNAS